MYPLPSSPQNEKNLDFNTRYVYIIKKMFFFFLNIKLFKHLNNSRRWNRIIMVHVLNKITFPSTRRCGDDEWIAGGGQIRREAKTNHLRERRYRWKDIRKSRDFRYDDNRHTHTRARVQNLVRDLWNFFFLFTRVLTESRNILFFNRTRDLKENVVYRYNYHTLFNGDSHTSSQIVTLILYKIKNVVRGYPSRRWFNNNTRVSLYRDTSYYT